MEIRASNHRSKRDLTTHRIGFFGERGVGKTTVSVLVADRLSDRGRVVVSGEASNVVDDRPTGRRPARAGLETEWAIRDADVGVEPFERSSDEVDTAFVVATPETLGSVSAYERVADRTDTDLFLIVTRFTEADREAIREFDGPELAEYFYEDEGIDAALAAGEAPSLEEWTVEAILVESLQPERFEFDTALDALETGTRSIVNVEVGEEVAVAGIVRTFRSRGFLADFFDCNCRCHDGHVIARSPSGDHRHR
ncbi:hypothetical protein J2751_002922 [Halorubrum alkaliphilum]|uniref:Uncharacterized protein n=1 Tax=Halorubrum alkaliphilum TaxID=261290 RepID=A0A8T4GHX8_9EURY|nr:hypothetical protein [Halorubrum alkaliphilum]MBP1923876.1 hypothetical protein [Halorubrum alkaliphilum]